MFKQQLKKLLFKILITSILFQSIIAPVASAYTTNPSSLIYELPVRETTTRDIQSNQYEKVIYHHNDHLSSSSIDTDQNGNLVNAVNYDPFGVVKTEQINSDYRNPKRYTGKELDGTGLYYYGARYYDPSIGRFISQDPVNGTLSNPQSINKYSYVLNNPLKYIDPTGMFAWDTFGTALMQIGNSILSSFTAGIQFGGGLLSSIFTKTPFFIASANNLTDSFVSMANGFENIGRAIEDKNPISYNYNPVHYAIDNSFNNYLTNTLAHFSYGLVDFATGMGGLKNIQNTIKNVDDMFKNPWTLLNKTPENLNGVFKTAEKEGWEIGQLGRGVNKGEGFSLRYPLENGKYDSKAIFYNPGGGHHGSLPYWKVSSPKGGIVRVGEQFLPYK
ncbi:MAG: RHS repeat-associated core domain-containing protein [Candidatus Gracilibacteria bacterium]